MATKGLATGLAAATMVLAAATAAVAQTHAVGGDPPAARPPAPLAATTAAPAAPVASLADTATRAVDTVAGLVCRALVPGAPPLCTDGPEPRREVGDATPSDAHLPAGGQVGCYGTGKDGDRVLAYYVYVSGNPDRFTTYAPSIQRWAAQVDNVFDQSAAETGGVRHVRWVTDKGTPGCQVVVGKLAVSPTAARSLDDLVREMQAKGLDRPNIKYLVWMDADVICGQGTVYVDATPGASNANNGGYPSYARVDRSCWDYAEAHELMHMLGAVQTGAPHATPAGHCTDGADVMCYDDGTGGPQRAVCGSSHAWRFDCGHDDYFSTRPAAGSWLATHWNTASSAFLEGATPAPASRPAPAPAATPKPAPPAPQPAPSASPAPAPDPVGSLGAATGAILGDVLQLVPLGG